MSKWEMQDTIRNLSRKFLLSSFTQIIPVRILFFVFAFALMLQSAQGQYCGLSGNFTCVVTDSIPATGYYPPPDSFPSFINNLQTKTSIYFLNFDSILFGDEVLHVYSLTFDSVNNLPPGLCWQTDQPDNTYDSSQTGCLQFSGTPCGSTGQYKLITIITLNIGSPVTTDGDGGGFEYFVRLKNYGDPDTPIDTSQTDSTPIIYYGDTCHPELPLTINLGGDSIFCPGTIINFNGHVNGGLPPYTYTWQSSTASLSCAGCPNPVATLYQNSSFTLLVSDANNETAIQTVNYTVAGNQGDFQITALGSIVNCDTGTVILISNPGVSAGYQWLKNDSVIPGARQNSYVVIDSPGAYSLWYDETGVCSATSNIIPITFPASPVVTISTFGTANLCLGSIVILQATAADTLNYQWQLDNSDISDSTTSVYVATSPGDYRLIVNTAQYCYDTSNVITVVSNPNPPTPVSFAEYLGDTICNDTSAFALTGGTPPGGAYSGTGVSNNNFNPESAVPGSNVITYTYTDSNGCSNWATDSITVMLCSTGIEMTAGNLPLLIFPNPVSDWLYVQSPLLSKRGFTAKVFDVTGKLITLKYNEQNTVQADRLMLDLSQLSAGLYFLDLRTSSQNVVKKFVKVH